MSETISPALLPVWEFLARLFGVWQFGWSLVAFIAIWRDKQLATESRTRIPERQLHRFEAWGGWAGSFLAQQIFRHKRQKATYQRVFQRITVLWMLGWAAVLGISFWLGSAGQG